VKSVQPHICASEKRSAAYLRAMPRLDAGAHHANRSALDALIEAIANEFPELGIEQRPSGIVSQCYLGAPYEVHICDLGGGIIEHFETFRAMPPMFERGRTLLWKSTRTRCEPCPSMDRVSVIEK
jgi:hypothetical protein